MGFEPDAIRNSETDAQPVIHTEIESPRTDFTRTLYG